MEHKELVESIIKSAKEQGFDEYNYTVHVISHMGIVGQEYDKCIKELERLKVIHENRKTNTKTRKTINSPS